MSFTKPQTKVNETKTTRFAPESLRYEVAEMRSAIESIKDELATIRSYVVIGIENPNVNGLKQEIARMYSEVNEAVADSRQEK